MLTLCLRHLERDGLITRTTHPSNPPRVDYTLTALGGGLVAEFKRLQGWILAHADGIAAARAAFDARERSDAP
jgi:DNA-binding HxlR family transcriptional regulator